MTIAFERLWAVTIKEVRQLFRDRLTFGMIVGIPLIQILLFGYAINFDVRGLSAHVVDQANTAASRQLVAELQASQVLRVTGHAHTALALEERLRRGDTMLGLVIPHDFERRLHDNRPLAQLLVSGSDPIIVNVAANLRQFRFQPDVLAGPPAAPDIETRIYYNPERRTAVQIVPGLMGVILNLTMVLFTAVAIVRERERGNMELLITTPTRISELMIGKLLPYIVIGLVQVSLILGVGAWLFEVPVRGGLADLYLASVVFIAAALAMGLLISTVASNQFQAMQLTFFFFLPSILLSGFMFPFEGMPVVVQWVAELLPLTHYLRLVRGIVLRDAAFLDLATDTGWLIAFFIVVLGLTMLRFNKRLD